MSPIDRDRVKRLESLQPLAGASGGGGVTPNPSWFQPTWFIDPQNRTGLASDGNDGATITTPVRTWNGGVSRRYGTLFPRLGQDTTWNFLSGSPTDGSDPIVFYPTIINNARPLFLGTYDSHNRVKSGVIAGFVAKNYTTGTLQAANLGALVTTNMMVQNTTVGKLSRAWSYVNIGGTTFSLSQPMVPADMTLNAPAFVDTWANGDTFDVYVPDAVEFLDYKPTYGGLIGGLAPNRALIQNLGVLAPASSSAAPFYVGDIVCLLDGRCDRRLVIDRPAFDRNFISINTIYTDPFGAQGGVRAPGIGLLVIGIQCPRFIGGFGGISVQGAIIDGNFILATYNGSSSCILGSVLGTVYIDAAGVLAEGTCPLGAFFYDGPRLWGPGSYQQDEGCAFLTDTAVNTFKILGPILIGSQTVAFTATQAPVPVFAANVPITPSNIDLHNAPAGIGMFLPGGGRISNVE